MTVSSASFRLQTDRFASFRLQTDSSASIREEDKIDWLKKCKECSGCLGEKEPIAGEKEGEKGGGCKGGNDCEA